MDFIDLLEQDMEEQNMAHEEQVLQNLMELLVI